MRTRARARADLGFAPVGRPRSRACARCSPGWKRFGNDETFARRADAGRRGRRSPACGASRSQVPPGTAEADKFLFQRGEEEFKERNWLAAREYYRQIVDNYPQSPYRPDAKLAVGDTYIGEDTTESLLLAVNEFREFLTFYPDQPARRLRAVPARRTPTREQMLAPDRDQTRDARRRSRSCRCSSIAIRTAR